MPRSQTPDLDTRKRIYRHASRYPGLHLSELTRAFPLAASTVRYHLDHLVREGLLTRVEESGYVRFYPRVRDAVAPRDALGREEKRVVALLRQRLPLGVVLHLLREGEASQGTLAGGLGAPPSTLAHHLGKLRKAGVVEARREGRETRYRLADPVRVGDLVYGWEAPKDLADAFTDLFEDLGL